MRKLVWTLLSLMLWLPLNGHALGLGEIRLHSALNQPLDAEIDLLSVGSDDLDTLNAELASFEVFSQLGVDRPASLIHLNFAAEAKANGEHVIRVTTSKPVREPFLDFIVEVSWRAGRLLREYTLLLDPPRTHEESAPAVSTPAAAPVAAAAPTVEARAASMPAAIARPAAAAATSGGSNSYGPVQDTDTLWAIARQMRGDRAVSVQQMMMALYQGNPQAFDGNINRLKKGSVLRLDPNELRAMSRRQAAAEVARQTREWENHRIRAAEAAAKRRTGAGVTPATPAAVAAAEEPRLKLSVPEEGEPRAAGAAGAGEGEDAGALRQELMAAEEESEVRRQENEELQKRMVELEQQLADMQQLLSLKDQDLAALQAQLRGEEAPAVEPVVEAEVKPESVEATAPVEPVAEAPKAVEPAKPVEPVAKPKPVVVPEPVEPASFVDEIMTLLLDNLMYVGAFFGVLLLLLGLIVYRRRKGGEFQESILSGGTSSMMRGGDDESSSTETSFFSDLASGAGAVHDESEVDPLTEADVYMAYGRHQQAEELLKEAIEENPERAELHVKLQELYYKTKDAAGFAAAAAATHALLEGTGPQWEKVLVMGHELCPDNELFAAAPEGVSLDEGESGAAESAVADEDVLDIGLDLDELAQEMESVSGGGEEIDLGLDFSDLEGLDVDSAAEGEKPAATEEKPSEVEPEEAPEESAEIDFGLDDLDFGGGDEAGAEVSEESAAEVEFDIGDFGLDEASEEPAAEAVDEAPAEEPAAEASDDNAMEFDLGAMDLGVSESEEVATDEEPKGNEMEFDLGAMGDLNLGGEEEAPAEDEPKGNEMEFDLDAMAEMDLTESDDAGLESEPAEEAAEEGAGDNDLDFDLGDLNYALDEVGSGETAESLLEASDEEPAASEDDSDMEFDLSGLDDLGDLGELDSGDSAETPAADGGDDMLGDLGLDDDLLGGSDSEMATKLNLAQAYIGMDDSESARGMLEEVVAGGSDEQKAQAEELLKQLQG